MRITSLLTTSILLAALAAIAWPQDAKAPNPDADSQTPVESSHVSGPHGLEGWTLLSPVPDHPGERYAFTLVIARNGKVVQRISGDPIVWRWMFTANGRHVAYETGPLHFGMSCVLAEVKSGRRSAPYDCYHEIPDDAPAWVLKLEGMR
jgi:hypothetical protein